MSFRSSLMLADKFTDTASTFSVLTDTGANIKATSESEYTNQLAWIKDRDNANSHQVADSVRGTSAILRPETSAVETTYTTPSGNSFAWVWSLPNTGSSNTNGSITSTVSAGTSITATIYTGNNSSGATVGHGASSVPEMVILKSRSVATNWYVYHKDLTSTGYQVYINLSIAEDPTTTALNNKAPTSTVIELPAGGFGSNNNSETYYFLSLISVLGESKIGSYTGNTTTEPSITGLGATGKAVMIKRIDSSGNWVMIDSVRGDNYVYANSSSSEGSANYIDFTSDGFDIVAGVTNADVNANGATYIYALWA